MFVIVQFRLTKEDHDVRIQTGILIVEFTNFTESLDRFRHLVLHNEPLRSLIQVKESQDR